MHCGGADEKRFVMRGEVWKLMGVMVSEVAVVAMVAMADVGDAGDSS